MCLGDTLFVCFFCGFKFENNKMQKLNYEFNSVKVQLNASSYDYLAACCVMMYFRKLYQNLISVCFSL